MADMMRSMVMSAKTTAISRLPRQQQTLLCLAALIQHHMQTAKIDVPSFSRFYQLYARLACRLHVPSLGQEELLHITTALQASGLVTFAKLKKNCKGARGGVTQSGFGRNRGRGGGSPVTQQSIRIELSLQDVETAFQDQPVLNRLLEQGKKERGLLNLLS
eukprot:gb/GEZN01014492.1/.p1 GENE.gb/GEZN01014492.1/~~gb/GEZN01014492.1/.p1  ORF type:complete len:161 (+),score=27.48 gb/GEZN01014492.1/:364-846(+)